ncbi:MAG: 16S rRNA (guanine(527)-N(7))-methyltransferase RsmG [Bacteroidales bacterium]|jgi:16S rRNA (guanine527-N7)-methyltransferase|nr:16S rRNA (guanine(527)-N(7))-methyltransferase RsmG [Bacteroidales bacterium]MDD4383975.1 16S rRNA (guanine(527)-N(7))-methyltransferase RsmG [Bacteroidales bacterium]MDY0196380.1 16S rRNA (guanine(527)-N(7))-methyltransferase RsmG [Tenuifilaceae bacterium]
MDVVFKYFPELTITQRNQLLQLPKLYEEWNAMINVVSRKDIEMLAIHHVLHSLAIAKVISFAKGTKILDIGTGGGFPGIPLAILFPQVSFTLVDSIGKKITVAKSVAEQIGLTNVVAQKGRVEELNANFDFAVTRAVAPVAKLMEWTKRTIKPGGYNSLPNGVIALKGGDISQEIKPFGRRVKKWKISGFFEEDYFAEKLIVYVSN